MPKPKRETWRPVPGHEDAYEASTHGRVRSVERVGRRTVADGKQVDVRRRGVVLTPTRRGAYLYVNLAGRTRAVHLVVLETFVGPRPWPTAECRHLDGQGHHNWPSNLRWGTRAENAADKTRHGTHNHTRQTTCRRRGHLLAGANLEKWAAARGHRACLACNRGYGDAIYYGRQGIHYDRDILADQYYAWLVNGGPRPRSTPALRDEALTVPRDAWVPARAPRAPGEHTRRVTWVIRHDFTRGEVFGPRDVLARMAARGVVAGYNAVTNALGRAVRAGRVEKLQRGRYRRLGDFEEQV